jgi:hypothetical protein
LNYRSKCCSIDITATSTEITCVAGNNDGTISVAATGDGQEVNSIELLLMVVQL